MIRGFDAAAYLAANPDIKQAVESEEVAGAEEHLLHQGLSEVRAGERPFHAGFQPFDEAMYIERFEDVRLAIESGSFTSGFDHFVQFGYDEIINDKRVWPKEKIDQIVNTASGSETDELSSEEAHEYHVLSHCELIDWDAYALRYEAHDPILHYLKNWRVLQPVIDGFFDTHFYVQSNRDVADSGINPLYQYIQFGHEEGRVGFVTETKSNELIQEAAAEEDSLTEMEQNDIRAIKAYNLDWSGYFEVNGFQNAGNLDPIVHYVLHYRALKPIIAKAFDTQLYYTLYGDVRSSNMNPLIHYYNFGQQEGRVAWIDIDEHISKGALESKDGVETLVIVTHESSATGAPLVSLNLAKSFCNAFNVINVILRRSDMHDEYLKRCEYLIEGSNHEIVVKKAFDVLLKDRKVLAVLCNSVESFPVLKTASQMGFPTVSLVHEFADYTRPLGKMSETVFYADRLVVPASLLKGAILNELKKLYAIRGEPKNIVVQPQGKLPMIPESVGENLSPQVLLEKVHIVSEDNETRVVIGAGYVQIRKGVDLFLSMAKQVQDRYEGRCKFIWVGAGYDPVKDLEYSVWLKRQFEMFEGESDFIFLDHQKNLDNVLEIADVFALTSRMDPFPNVVVDALTSNVHVACFRESTGCAEFLEAHNADASVVDYLDTDKMADAVIANLRKYKTARRVGSRRTTKNSKIVEEYLDFRKYAAFLLELCEEAKENTEENQAIVHTLLEEDAFDAEYYAGQFVGDPEEINEKCRMYVNLGKKGIHLYNPKPGFAEMEWINSTDGDTNQVAVYNALMEKKTVTHDVAMLQGSALDKDCPSKIGIHLHVHYLDLLDEFAQYFSTLRCSFDILVTLTSAGKSEEVETLLQGCGADNIIVVEVENKGRDIGPLFSDLKKHILEGDYDIIGHFHTKKSINTNAEMGERWRKFLLEHLLADEVLLMFENEKLGLIFPEDRHCVDFGLNKPFSDELCQAMWIPPKSHADIFPLGMMFWARVDALKPLFLLEFEAYVQNEPLPYDGSFVHAVERLLPYVSQKQGFTFCTVHKKGSFW